MSEDFTVSGGGSTRVATEELATHTALLRAFVAQFAESRLRLANVGRFERELEAADVPVSAMAAQEIVGDCVGAMGWVQGHAELLAASLEVAAEVYGGVERLGREGFRRLAGEFAYGLGSQFPLLLLWGAPRAAGMGAAWMLATESQRAAMITLLATQSEMLSDPRVVALLRLSVSSVDEFAAGAAGVPRELLALLGDEGLRILGFATTAGLLTSTLRGLGFARETPVTVARTKLGLDVSPPTGLAERTRRIPTGTSQIKVERYIMPDGSERFEAYISGTRDPALVPGREPLDMTSNVTGMANESRLDMGDAGSVRAVQKALEAAGVTKDSPIVFTGHSQGAVVSLALANSGNYNTEAVFTVGGPTGELGVPEGVPYLALEHTEDIVPALGGVHSDQSTVVVRRSLFGGGEIPDSSLLPAHELTRYRESAELLDSANEQRVAEFSRTLDQFSAGASEVVSETYLARRVVTK